MPDKFGELNNFYEEYIVDRDMHEIIKDAYESSVSMLDSNFVRVLKDLVLKDVGIYRTIDFFSVSATEALYDEEEIVNHPKITNVVSDESFLKKGTRSRIDMFRDMDIDKKSDILEEAGHYIHLRIVADERSTPGKLVSAKVSNMRESTLSEGVDYHIRDDKVFLFGFAARKRPDNYALSFRSAIVDFNSARERLGIFAGDNHYPSITPLEYSIMTKAFLEAAYRGPTVKNIKEVIRSAFGESYTVIDKYSHDNDKMVYWETGTLTEFDYIVDVPEIYSIDDDRVNLIDDYLKLITPSESSYYINWDKRRRDGSGMMSKVRRGDEVEIKITDYPKDKVKAAKSSIEGKIIYEDKDVSGVSSSRNYDISERLRFDNGVRFDGKGIKDTNEYISNLKRYNESDMDGFHSSAFGYGLHIGISEDIRIGRSEVYADSDGIISVAIRATNGADTGGFSTVEEKTFNVKEGRNIIDIDFLLKPEVSEFWHLAARGIRTSDGRTTRLIRSASNTDFPMNKGSLVVYGGGYPSHINSRWYYFWKTEVIGVGIKGDLHSSVKNKEMIEFCGVKLSKHPEMPTSISSEVSDGEATISFKHNSEKVDKYDILKNDQVIGNVESEQYNEGEILSYTDEDYSDGDEYKIKSVSYLLKIDKSLTVESRETLAIKP